MRFPKQMATKAECNLYLPYRHAADMKGPKPQCLISRMVCFPPSPTLLPGLKKSWPYSQSSLKSLMFLFLFVFKMRWLFPHHVIKSTSSLYYLLSITDTSNTCIVIYLHSIFVDDRTLNCTGSMYSMKRNVRIQSSVVLQCWWKPALTYNLSAFKSVVWLWVNNTSSQ